MSEKVRVAIIEDHAIYRDGLTTAIERSTDLAYAGFGEGVSQGAELLSRGGIDVALVDLTLPDGSGLDLIAGIRDTEISALVLSMSSQPELVIRSIKAGARGYMVKDAGWPLIHDAIVAVSRGEVVFGTKVADRLLEVVAAQDAQRAAFPNLSRREHEVLEQLVAGRTNHDIARRLFLADKTVRNLVSSVMGKLNATSRHEAAEIARQAGLDTSELPTRDGDARS